jgi:hypothetical protein
MSPLEVAEAFVRLSATEPKVKSISLASVELARTSACGVGGGAGMRSCDRNCGSTLESIASARKSEVPADREVL